MSEPEDPVESLEQLIDSQATAVHPLIESSVSTGPSNHADSAEVTDENSVSKSRTRSFRRKLTFIATTLVVAAVVLAIALNSSPQKSLTPREAVIAAETAAAKPTTVSFALDATISSTKGKSFQVVNDPVKLSGVGASDRVTHSIVMNMKIKVATITIQVREILLKKSVFIKFGALTPYLKSGKTWVQVPSNLFGSNSTFTNVGTSPIILKMILKKEVTITADGSAIVNGTMLSLYKVKPDAAAIKKLAGSLSSTLRDDHFSITYVLGLDSKHIIRQVKGSILTTVGKTHTIEKISETILNYDRPVVIGEPSTKETEKLNAAQYAKLIQSSQSAPPSLV